MTNLGPILGGLGALLGAIAVVLQQRSQTTGSKLEIAWSSQQKRIDELAQDKTDLQNRDRERQREFNAFREEVARKDHLNSERQERVERALEDCEHSKAELLVEVRELRAQLESR